MDLDSTGTLSLTEIAIPHITLGVSSDSAFIKQVLRNINPIKFATEDDFRTKLISLREFL